MVPSASSAGAAASAAVMRELAILGSGTWGVALAVVLAPRFARIRLWYHRHVADLTGIPLPPHVTPTPSLAEALTGAGAIIGVMPSQHARSVYEEARPWIRPDQPVISATKGLDRRTLLRMSQMIAATLGPATPIAVLSGPTFAREIAAGQPSAVVIASDNAGLAAQVQSAFAGPTLRLYTNDDPVGVEIGGAVKNVIAIAAGVCTGLDLGSNALAALITRGLAEMKRLATASGGQAETLSGLAGLGDLVLTCTGALSRNRHVGIELAKGRSLHEIIAALGMVAEGVPTVEAAVALARHHCVELPITEQMFAMLHLGKTPQQAIRELMDRSLKSE